MKGKPENKRYFLVCPGSEREKHGPPAYWMSDRGGHWEDAARSRWKEKDERDLVLESVSSEHIRLLDWTRTPYYDPECNSGWLSREGRFYGCPTYAHDVLAHCVLGMKVPELEDLGWVRIYNENWYACHKRLSAEQMNWLSENGHRVYD